MPGGGRSNGWKIQQHRCQSLAGSAPQPSGCTHPALQVYLEQGAAGQSASPQLGAGAAEEPAQAGVPLSTWEEVARLLGRKHDRIDPMQGLPLLPGEVRPCQPCSQALPPGQVAGRLIQQ